MTPPQIRAALVVCKSASGWIDFARAMFVAFPAVAALRKASCALVTAYGRRTARYALANQ